MLTPRDSQERSTKHENDASYGHPQHRRSQREQKGRLGGGAYICVESLLKVCPHTRSRVILAVLSASGGPRTRGFGRLLVLLLHCGGLLLLQPPACRLNSCLSVRRLGSSLFHGLWELWVAPSCPCRPIAAYAAHGPRAAVACGRGGAPCPLLRGVGRCVGLATLRCGSFWRGCPRAPQEPSMQGVQKKAFDFLGKLQYNKVRRGAVRFPACTPQAGSMHLHRTVVRALPGPHPRSLSFLCVMLALVYFCSGCWSRVTSRQRRIRELASSLQRALLWAVRLCPGPALISHSAAVFPLQWYSGVQRCVLGHGPGHPHRQPLAQYVVLLDARSPLAVLYAPRRCVCHVCQPCMCAILL